MPQMGRLEYAESWAWVSMTRAVVSALIPDYLAQLKAAGKTRLTLHPAPQQRLPNPEARLQTWLYGPRE